MIVRVNTRMSLDFLGPVMTVLTVIAVSGAIITTIKLFFPLFLLLWVISFLGVFFHYDIISNNDKSMDRQDRYLLPIIYTPLSRRARLLQRRELSKRILRELEEDDTYKSAIKSQIQEIDLLLDGIRNREILNEYIKNKRIIDKELR